MILASVEIENYKQYAGSHSIDFPEQGMVAITGPNGAGKTTLFEAIEWCLYGPRTIPHASIPPHGGVGTTRVSVTLQDPHGGGRYVVRRTLRNGVSSAEAYSEDDPGQPLVQGPRDVSDYVARQLVGLPHAAFVSTFFTRQKELTFFGDRTPTDRRVEVARLLGFQTIRDAQEEIGEERSAARQDATSLRAQFERDAAGRDFEAEIAEAESAVTAADRLAAARQQRLTDADAAFGGAREELERWRGLQELDTAHERELLRIAGIAQAATSRQEAAQAELRRLQALAAERIVLEPEAARVDELRKLGTAMEAERERSRRLETLRQGRQAHGAQLAQTAAALRRVVESHGEAASGLDGWLWSEADVDDPCQAAARLGKVVATVDPRALRLRAERLARALDLTNHTGAARRNLDQYQSHREKLTAQRDAVLDEGDPVARLHAAEAAATSARAALEQAIGKLSEARQKRQESEELERIFDERTFNRICPTCTRPITDNEAARLLHTLRESTARVRAEEAAQEAHFAVAQAHVATADAERAATNELMQKLASLNERLSDGERMIAELEAEHARDLAELDSILAAAGLNAPPQATDVETAQAAAERAAQLATLAGTLEQLEHRAAVARDGVLEADGEIVALGPVSYDEEAHQKATIALDAARHAAAAIKRIDVELQAKPGYEATRREAERELTDLERQTRDVEQARQALGFDLVALRQARDAEAAAAEAQNAAREELAQAREALRDAQTALRRVIEDRDRLLGLIEAADRRGREADELERMYREFAEFDKFVADHVGPLLAETTERLLSLVTHGKYDRVRFDENYGIEVFDGDECFKLDGFSGGERDVVALCARLAMSELVGSSALRPPRFLVLDEVFGSLDSERRSQLLETLGSLAYGGHFQQMFIISHVDDVQQSPVMNEAWTIEERAGVSHVVRPESLTPALA